MTDIKYEIVKKIGVTPFRPSDTFPQVGEGQRCGSFLTIEY